MDNDNLTRLLISHRKLKGLTIEQTAKSAGVSMSSVCKAERGKLPLHSTALLKLLKFFKISKKKYLTDNPHRFWMNIRALRKYFNVSQKKLASAINMSAPYLNQAENGIAPARKYMISAAAFFGMSVFDINNLSR